MGNKHADASRERPKFLSEEYIDRIIRNNTGNWIIIVLCLIAMIVAAPLPIVPAMIFASPAIVISAFALLTLKL